MDDGEATVTTGAESACSKTNWSTPSTGACKKKIIIFLTLNHPTDIHASH